MKTITFQDYRRRILRVLVHIQQKLDEPLNLEDLAEVANFSPFHFHRVFSGMLGESVHGHVRRLRLERAATQLGLGSQPVTDIAFNAGYEPHEAFTRAFKTSFGVSPSLFRAQRRPIRLDEASPASGRVHYREGKLQTFRASKQGVSAMKADIQKIPSRRVAFVRHVGPYESCGEAWDHLSGFLGKEGWLPESRACAAAPVRFFPNRPGA